MIKLNKLLYFAIITLALIGCGSGRNFEGSPNPFEDSNLDLAESTDYKPESLFGFQPKQDGFSFNVFQRSSNGYYGNSINIQVNMKNLRLSIGNVSSGTLECNPVGESKVCQVKWLSVAPFYSFDVSQNLLKFEIKPVVAVFKNESYKSANLDNCVLADNEDFIHGEKLTVSLINVETQEQKNIFYYNFDSGNKGSVLGTITTSDPSKISYYYSFDFDSYFSSTAYFFDVYPTKQVGEFNLYRMGARALDSTIETLIHFCFYDKI